MKSKKIRVIFVLSIILCVLLTSCFTTDNYTKEQLKISPENDTFYILGTGDDSGICYTYQTMFNEAGLKAKVIFNTSDVLKNEQKAIESSSGTGFYISSHEIVTNAHVLDDKQIITIINNGISYTATVKYIDKSNDIAILDTNHESDYYFPIANSNDYQVTDSIFVLGFPLSDTMGQNIKITQGIINATTGYKDDQNLIQISAPIQPGNSGAPVINYDFKVVGIATSSLVSDNTPIQNVNYAIKSNILKLLSSNSVQTEKYVKDIDSAMKATVQIVCNNEAQYTAGKPYLVMINSEYTTTWAYFLSSARCIDLETGEVIASARQDALSTTIDIAKEKICKLLIEAIVEKI